MTLKDAITKFLQTSETIQPVTQHRMLEDPSAQKHHRQNHKSLKYQHFNHENN